MNAIQTTSKCFISRFIIGTIGQNEQLETQSNLLDILNTYEGQDGHEIINPINVIKETYASNKPFMLAIMHLSYSELFQHVRISLLVLLKILEREIKILGKNMEREQPIMITATHDIKDKFNLNQLNLLQGDMIKMRGRTP